MNILHLNPTMRSDNAEIGGKCANIIQLLQMGIPVPNALVITTSVYEEQAIRCSLNEKIFPFIEKQDWAEVESSALEMFTACSLDDAFSNDLRRHYRRMSSPAVAVRSSATCEDQDASSSAGQYETYLNIQGEEDLLLAVRKCWASLWNRRALFYRNRRSMDHFSARMAVIVQEMVPADAAGVLFTVDPLQQDENRIRVEIAPGLGDAIVTGNVAGDVYRVDRDDLTQTGGDDGLGLLSPDLLIELCGMALGIEEYFGAPQDIEFAIANEKIHILQARPMTALADSPVEPIPPLGKPSLLDKMIKPFADERYVVAPRPLDNIVVKGLLGGHLYAIKECGARIREEDEAALRAQIWRQAYRMPPVHRIWVMFFRAMPLQFRQLKTDWLSWWENGPSEALQTISEPVNLSLVGDEELFTRADMILAVWEKYSFKRMSAAGGIHAESLLRFLVMLAVGYSARDEVMANLMAGIETPTMTLNADLWRLSRLARRDAAVLAAVREAAPERLTATAEGREFLEAFQSFIDTYGHREGSCWYLTTPTWRQDPKQVWRLLSSMVEAEERTGNPEQALSRRLGALSLVQRRLRPIPGLPGVFRWLWSHLSRLNAFREKSHYDLSRPLDALQAIAAEWGRRLFGRGLLEREDDVGFLTCEEVREWLCGGHPAPDDAHRLVARRRATYRLVNAAWQKERAGGAVRGEELKGIAASPGMVRGKARIIHGEHEFNKLLEGEILVSPYTNPAWTPLFASAAAVVTETGGVSSHAAIVAREYGIPAVMAVPRVTRVLKDGQEILVDGSRGIVSR